VSELVQDVRYGFRVLANSPGFATVAILTLGIGIGGNAAIFSFVDGILLKPLPYANADRIMRVAEKSPQGNPNGISTLNYLDWKKDNRVFAYLAAQRNETITLSGIREPIQLRGSRVSPQYFDVFSIKPVLGRGFADDEDQVGKERVVILGNPLWQTQFGADPAVIGHTILLNSEPHTIIGILPAGSAFDRAWTQIWRPLAFYPENMSRNFHWFSAVAFLKPGITFEQARAQMDPIAARIAHDYPDSNKGWGVYLERYADALLPSEVRQSLYVLMAAVGAVLLIGCVNLANLMLARSAAREREVAIRSSLGAGQWRLMRQFLTESVLLSFFGGILGIAIGYVTMLVLRALLPPFTLPRETEITMDARVLMFTLAISILAGILFGLAPAVSVLRANLASSMKEGGRGSGTGMARRRFRSALVVAEVALAFVLLTSAGLLIRSFLLMQYTDPGFDSTNVLTASLPIAEKTLPEPAQLNGYLRQILSGIEALPGVREAAMTSALPLEGWGYGMPFMVANTPFIDRANRPACFFKMVTPSYFHALGIRLLQGRGLTERDGKGSPPAIVINETMARKYFPNENPIGKRILIQEIVPRKTQLGPEIAWEVVGVVANEKVDGIDSKRDSAGVYVTIEQSPQYFPRVVVRAAMDPMTLQQAIRQVVRGVNKDQPLADVKSLEQLKSESLAPDRLRAIVLGVFAIAAVLLSGIGIYGVISYSVVQRTQEIGIRAALGASAGNVLNLILRNGMALTLVGLILGLGGALALTRLLSGILFGVGARDPMTLVFVPALLAVVSLLACYIPARRAAAVDPLVALRYE